MNSIIPISNVLQQIDAIGVPVLSGPQPSSVLTDSGAFIPEFGQLLKKSLENISTAQATVGQAYAAFEMGAPNISLSNVVIDGAKARIAFQESLEIRNRMVSAYSTIMQIPL